MADTILVVEDDRNLSTVIRSYLEEAGYNVLVAYDGETALHKIRQDRPILIVLDLMLPERDGWDITRIVRGDKHLHTTGIVMLTARIEDIDRIVGLEMGADDYMVKPFNPRELTARIRTVLRRIKNENVPIDDATLALGNITLNPITRQVYMDDLSISTTPTEFKILKMFMSYPNRVFTRAEIVETVFGYDYDSAERILDTHIRNLRKKLRDDNNTIIQTVYGVGYRIVQEN